MKNYLWKKRWSLACNISIHIRQQKIYKVAILLSLETTVALDNFLQVDFKFNYLIKKICPLQNHTELKI